MAIELRKLNINPYSWSTINAGTGDLTNSTALGENLIAYVTGIANTGQDNINYKIGDGSTQWQNLPYKLPVYIEVSANTNVSTYNFDINGNCLIFHNTSATARTITLDGSTSFSLSAYSTAIWRYNTAWWNEDDSESGTFTPALLFGGASTGITYTARSGKYTKNRNIITANGYILLSNKGSAVGSAAISSLPFSSNPTANNFSVASIKLSNISFVDIHQNIMLNNANTILLREATNAGVETNLTDVNFSNTSSIVFSITYFV